VLVQGSIKAAFTQKQQVDSVLLYLHKHGRHIDAIDLRTDLSHASADRFKLRQLPPHLQLTSLLLDSMCVQLQAGRGFSGVLGPATAGLKQLRQLHMRHVLW
jgi:hypothetical protein